MSTTTISRTDHEIQASVQAELGWTPTIDEAAIGVAVDNGTVTLSGDVDTYAQRVAAVKAAQRVRGVSTVADELRVHPSAAFGTRTDTDIAEALHRSFGWSADVPETVKAEVADHRVTLTGQVTWHFQREAARRIAENMLGVTGVDNRIALTPRAAAGDIAERITNAIARSAALDAQHITVSTVGNEVTLTGTVRSWAERSQAGRAAWNSPHVLKVHNYLSIAS
ncbi:MAG TPA: BON domain-containing protein [Pseudolysinimonas sp.]|nr:BON domain-containing protein [Pseudolysinimonas sp.]